MARMLIAANWKENPRTEKQAVALFSSIAKMPKHKSEVVIAAPFIYLDALHNVKGAGSISLGAQDSFWEEKGAFTSAIGPKMLQSLGVKYIIIGHSERRKFAKETDDVINKKIKLIIKDRLHVILCVGEPASVRKEGEGAARKYIERQLTEDLKGIKFGTNLTIAYEPIWAIGTGQYDKPEDASVTISAIKTLLKVKYNKIPRVLYGGSVNSENIGDYVQYKSINGVLVGGASLKADEFKKIITVVEKI